MQMNHRLSEMAKLKQNVKIEFYYDIGMKTKASVSQKQFFHTI